MKCFYLTLILLFATVSLQPQNAHGQGYSYNGVNVPPRTGLNRLLPTSRRGVNHREVRLSALDRMTNVTSMEEFLSLLIKDGRPVTHEDIYSKYPSESGQLVVAGGGRMAVSDQCSPRNMTVAIEVPGAGLNTIHYPKCTRIERCGGCCFSRHTSCVPTKKERVSLNVVKAVVPWPGSMSMFFDGIENVNIERHLACQVRCDLSAERCGPNRVFLPRQCKCDCINVRRCPASEIWRPDKCDCGCIRPKKCGHGRIFDERTCRCVINMNRDEVSGSEARDTRSSFFQDYLAQQQHYHQQQRQRQDRNQDRIPGTRDRTPGRHDTSQTEGSSKRKQTSPSNPASSAKSTTNSMSAPTKTVTTTTNTSTKRKVDPCASFNCPPRFTKRRTKGNSLVRCVCRPPRRKPNRRYFRYPIRRRPRA